MLNVYKSNRMERLLAALAGVVARPAGSPFAPEWIGVQSRGMETWVALELSRRLGIWANAWYPFPRALITRLFELVLGDELPDSSPYQADTMTWAILDLLPRLLDRPEFDPLRCYLDGDRHGLKRFQLAGRIADLFDQYAVYRPEMVLSWERASAEDWQPILWNALVERFGPVHLAVSAGRFFERVKSGEVAPGLFPPRLTIFGLSTLPPLFLQVLAGLPDEVAVNLFVLCPSREYWAHIRSQREIIRTLRREGGETAAEPALHLEQGHPLLASLGGVGRDFQEVLESCTDYCEPGDDLFVDPEEAGVPGMLAGLQSDILNLRRPNPAGRRPIDPSDPSIAIQSCHGPLREVEVLHDELLGMFQDDPHLQPHDVVVMMPDVEVYAPYLDAVFGAGGQDRPAIPYRLADRSPRRETAVVDAFQVVLDLAGRRLTLEEVFDLASREVVGRRFGLTSEFLEQAYGLCLDAGVRWGMDAAARGGFRQPEMMENTWRFGLDRLLLGYALPGDEGELFAGVSPFGEMEGQSAEVLGRLADFLETLFTWLRLLAHPRPVAEWAECLAGLPAALINRSPENEPEHQLLRQTLAGLAEGADRTGFKQPVELDVIRAVLDQRLDRDRSMAGFLGGGVTCCNLLPMRSIPFKVVCLLGMNDGEFPRVRRPPGFDRMASRPRPGDRSSRHDDRYLFLEALLSARERLLITYRGQNLQDNRPIPPSVVVDELLDSVAESAVLVPEAADAGDADPRGQAIRRRLVRTQPLPPFSPRCFGAGTAGEPASFDAVSCEGARAIQAPRIDPPVFLRAPLPAPEEAIQVIRVEDLLRFFRQPAGYFLKERLGIRLPDEEAAVSGREPLALDKLEEFSLGSWLLDRLRAGADAAAELPLMKAMGVLPLGTPGQFWFEGLVEKASPLSEALRQTELGEKRPPVPVDLGVAGVRLTGSLGELWSSGRWRVSFGRMTGKRLLELWIGQLVLDCAAGAEAPPRSVLICRDDKDSPVRVNLPSQGSGAPDLLAGLVGLYREGLRRPLRFFPNTSFRYAERIAAGKPEPAARSAMASAWRSIYGSGPGEGDHPAVRLAFREVDPLAESVPGDDLDFRTLALRVFGPLLAAIAPGEEP